MRSTNVRRAGLAGLGLIFLSALRAETTAPLTAFGDSAPPLETRQVRDRLEALGPLLMMDGEVTDFDRFGASSPAGKPTLKRSVIGNRTLTLAQAIASLRTMLNENSTPAARAAFAASPQYKDARKCRVAAAGALAAKRVTAALAALLRARELEPKNPVHLFNLAGLTTRVGLPRHTLALLDAADKLGAPKSGYAVTARAAALTNRGHALIQLKRFAEAETVLREAATLAPALSEARVNLAHALYQQNDPAKKQQAMQTMRFARWRKATPSWPTKSAPGAGPAVPTRPTAPADEDDDVSDAQFEAERKGRPPASALFDLARRKSGGLPTIKIPRTIADGYAMYPKVRKLQSEVGARMDGIVQRMNELDRLMRQRERSGAMSPAGVRRARDVFWYIAFTQTEAPFRSLWREVVQAGREPGLGLSGGQHDNPWGDKELDEKYQRIQAAHMRRKDYCDAMWAATEPFQATWQGPIRRMESAINRYYHVTYPHMTALAANLGDPIHHEYAMLMIEQKGLALMSYLLGPLHTVCFFNTHCVEDWGLHGPAGQAEEPKAGEFTVADMCGALSQAGYKAVLDLEVVELSINCEKVGAELSAGEWVKLFAEAEATFDGEVTIFMGGAVEGEIPFIGVVETGSKAGGFITIDFDKGIVDAGVKSTESIKVGVGPVGVEREVEHTYVIATFGGP